MSIVLIGSWQILAGGIGGGLLAEFLRWYGLKDSANLTVFQKSPYYWILSIGIILIGGVWAVITSSSQSMDVIAALSLGASAPALITATIYAGTTAPTAGESTTTGQTLQFIAGRS
ncbi:MAG: hypothetical protein WC620_06730 [Methanoregula sp.]|jgi:hypothetical protein